MKKINLMILGVGCFYLLFIVVTGIFLKGQSEEKSREYLVEVNRIMRGMEEQGYFSMPDLDQMIYVKEVSFLETGEDQNSLALQEFFRKKNHYETHVEPSKGK